MKFQKLFGVFLVAVMMTISGYSRAQDQTPVQTPDSTQVPTADQTPAPGQPTHKHKHPKRAAVVVDSSDISSRLDSLEQQNEALQDRIQALENSGMSAGGSAEVVHNGKIQTSNGIVIGEEFDQLKDATEYFADEEPRKLVFGDSAHTFAFLVSGFVEADYNYIYGPPGQYLMDDYSKEGTQKEFNGFLARRAHIDFGAEFTEAIRMNIGLESDKSTAVSMGFTHAYVSFKIDKALEITAGKFSNILTLEGLQPSADIPMGEASMAVQDLSVNKDIGVLVSGTFNKMIDYGVELANGQEDDESSATGPGHPDTDAKTGTARIFITPFRKDDDELLKGLGFGIAGSWGSENGAVSISSTTPAENGLWNGTSSGLQTAFAGNLFFAYNASVTADGDNYHWDPQFYYYHGSFGLQGEIIHSMVNAANGGSNVLLDNSGWMLEGTYVLGGKERFEGAQVDQPFDMDKGTWGAFEFVAEMSQIQIDVKSFESGYGFSPNGALGTGAQDATAFGAGVNWWLNNHSKLSALIERTWFDGGNVGAIAPEQEAIFRATVIM